MGPVGARLAGDRLHLQHGPIDLVIGVDGAREAAFDAAALRFETVLDELVAELPVLRAPMPACVTGEIAGRMVRAVDGYHTFVTPMAAVAGAVADGVLAAILAVGGVARAYVNNGGDIAVWLGVGQRFEVGLADLGNRALGRVCLRAGDGVGGIATSGRGGRSLSRGIADSVTVLACCAADADAAATLIANAVNVESTAILRVPASAVQPDSDLADRLVVTGVGVLRSDEVALALNRGALLAQEMLKSGRILGAGLFLQGEMRSVGDGVVAQAAKRIKEYA
jgi:ApbE superfamily uncharacterized protein (UPF0280 family)